MKHRDVLPILKPLVPALGLLLMASCVSMETAAPPVDKLTLSPKANKKELAEGRQIFAENCNQCHGPPRVAGHSADKWEHKILPKMCKKADLDEKQSKLLTEYVLTAHEALGGH